MIRPTIAQKFVDRLCSHVDHNINVMNEQGIIIACRDRERLGSFHEVAYEIVHHVKDVVVVYPDDNMAEGVRAGANVPVLHRDHIIGVVGVTGNPSEVLSLALAIKTSIETMVTYEAEKEQLQRRDNSLRLFTGTLLFDDYAAPEELSRMATRLGFDPRAERVPLLVRPAEESDVALLHRLLRDRALCSSEDMVLVLPDQTIVVFKAFGKAEGTYFDSLRQTVCRLVGQLTHSAPAAVRDRLAVAVGSPQAELSAYAASYRHAVWTLERAMKEGNGKHCGGAGPQLAFFLDSAVDFLLSRVDGKDVHATLGAVRNAIGARLLESYAPTIITFVETNQSIKETAGRLNVHRNTVQARLQRIREETGLDVINSSADRMILYLNARVYL